MLTEPLADVLRRARRVLRAVPPEPRERLALSIAEDRAQVGGGALPTVELPSAGLSAGRTAAEARRLDEALRSGKPPVLGRLVEDRLFLDCRTVLRSQVPTLAQALVRAAALL